MIRLSIGLGDAGTLQFVEVFLGGAISRLACTLAKSRVKVPRRKAQLSWANTPTCGEVPPEHRSRAAAFIQLIEPVDAVTSACNIVPESSGSTFEAGRLILVQ